MYRGFLFNDVTAVLTSPKSSISNNNDEFQKAKFVYSIIINASNTIPKKRGNGPHGDSQIFSEQKKCITQ